MKISIVTATYNSGKTLCDTLESVLGQDYADFEHLIIDGGSKDDTLDIVRRYEPRYRGRLRWISERDRGIYDAMNKGIAMATGDVVGILNSDDLYNDQHVLSDIAAAFDGGGVDAVYGNLYFVKQDETGCVVRVWKGSPYKRFATGWHPAHPTFYASRWCFERFGSFDISFDVSADFELMLRFIEKGGIATRYLDRYFVRMRVGGESTGSIKNIIKGNKNIIKAFKKNGIKVSPLYPVYRLLPKFIGLVKSKIGLGK